MEQESKKDNYELAFWLKDENDEPAKKIISKHGAEIVKERPIQKMKLSFPIRKENFAFLGTIIFSADSSSVGAISSDLNLENLILRYFLRRAKKPSAEMRRENPETSRGERKPFFRLRDDSKKGSETVLTNEALEKKIEEILN